MSSHKGVSSKDMPSYYEKRSLAQNLIDENIKFILVGLEYVLEVRKDNDVDLEKCSFICTICSMKLNSKSLLPHIRSVPHRMKFAEIHCPDVYRKFKKTDFKEWTSSHLKDFFIALKSGVGGIKGLWKNMAVCSDADKFSVIGEITDRATRVKMEMNEKFEKNEVDPPKSKKAGVKRERSQSINDRDIKKKSEDVEKDKSEDLALPTLGLPSDFGPAKRDDANDRGGWRNRQPQGGYNNKDHGRQFEDRNRDRDRDRGHRRDYNNSTDKDPDYHLKTPRSFRDRNDQADSSYRSRGGQYDNNNRGGSGEGPSNGRGRGGRGRGLIGESPNKLWNPHSRDYESVEYNNESGGWNEDSDRHKEDQYREERYENDYNRHNHRDDRGWRGGRFGDRGRGRFDGRRGGGNRFDGPGKEYEGYHEDDNAGGGGGRYDRGGYRRFNDGQHNRGRYNNNNNNNTESRGRFNGPPGRQNRFNDGPENQHQYDGPRNQGRFNNNNNNDNNGDNRYNNNNNGDHRYNNNNNNIRPPPPNHGPPHNPGPGGPNMYNPDNSGPPNQCNSGPPPPPTSGPPPNNFNNHMGMNHPPRGPGIPPQFNQGPPLPGFPNSMRPPFPAAGMPPGQFGPRPNFPPYPMGGPRGQYPHNERPPTLPDPKVLENYKKAETEMEQEHRKLEESYEQNPFSHPQFEMEKNNYWMNRTNELRLNGMNPDMIDIKGEWTAVWNRRLKELCLEDLSRKRDQLMIQFNIRPCDLQLHASQVQASNASSANATTTTTTTTNTFAFNKSKKPANDALNSKSSLLTQLKNIQAVEDMLGSHKITFSALMKKVSSIDRPIDVFRDYINELLVDLVKKHLTSQLLRIKNVTVKGRVDAAIASAVTIQQMIMSYKMSPQFYMMHSPSPIPQTNVAPPPAAFNSPIVKPPEISPKPAVSTPEFNAKWWSQSPEPQTQAKMKDDSPFGSDLFTDEVKEEYKRQYQASINSKNEQQKKQAVLNHSNNSSSSYSYSSTTEDTNNSQSYSRNNAWSSNDSGWSEQSYKTNSQPSSGYETTNSRQGYNSSQNSSYGSTQSYQSAGYESHSNNVYGLDIASIAKATLNLSAMQVVQYVAKQFEHIGRTPTEDMLHQVLTAVSAINKKTESSQRSSESYNSNSEANRVVQIQMSLRTGQRTINSLYVEELKILLSNFKNIERDQQKQLTSYLKELESFDPQKLKELRILMNKKS